MLARFAYLILAALVVANLGCSDARTGSQSSSVSKFLGTWQHLKYPNDRVQISAGSDVQLDLLVSSPNMAGGIFTRRSKATLVGDALVDQGTRVAWILDNGHLYLSGREYARQAAQ